MNYYEKLLEIRKIREAMMDEESRDLFDAKIDYMITRNKNQFYDIADKYGKNGYSEEFEKAMKKNDHKGIIIFGCGHDGLRTKRILENCGYFPDFFCDSDMEKVGKMVEGLKVISVDKLIERYKDFLVVLGSSKYIEEMYRMLLEKKFPSEGILYPEYDGILLAHYGRQYFDVFEAGAAEIFVDGGGYDGNTAVDFMNWTDGKYRRIHIFEPNSEMFHLMKRKIEENNIDKVEAYNFALWDKKENLCFLENDSGSYIAEEGQNTVKGVCLDEAIKDDKVTFIKMDVEGSELKALKGAQQIIKRNKPKLAICIYHRPEDILELPLYILELAPEYKFYIRHYSTNMWETVLYAEAKKRT